MSNILNRVLVKQFSHFVSPRKMLLKNAEDFLSNAMLVFTLILNGGLNQRTLRRRFLSRCCFIAPVFRISFCTRNPLYLVQLHNPLLIRQKPVYYMIIYCFILFLTDLTVVQLGYGPGQVSP